MTTLFVMTMLLGGVWIGIFLANLRELLSTPAVVPQAITAQPLPRVSILVPARNEESNIEACLRSLLAQDHPDFEVIVVDDRSSDHTPEIVENLRAFDPRLRLVRASDPPPGWMGKCNALCTGISQGSPTGEWLLFTDADTIHHPACLRSSLQVALRDGLDLLSLVPHLEGCGFWERLMQPSVAALIALFNRPGRVNDPSRPEVFANGQYILVRRQAYLAAGGHAAVAGKVLEDVELARVLVRAGSRMRLALGRDLFRTRMYHNLSDLVHGWTKNFYMILHSRLHRVLAAGTTALLLSLWPAVFGLGSITALISGWRPWPVAWLWSAVAVYAMVLVFQVALRALNRWYPAYAPLAPLANLVAVFILLRSSWLHLRGRGVQWKGRQVVDDREGKR